jgi:hypothetical protein
MIPSNFYDPTRARSKLLKEVRKLKLTLHLTKGLTAKKRKGGREIFLTSNYSSYSPP